MESGLFGFREWEVAPGREAEAEAILRRLEDEHFSVTKVRPEVVDYDHPGGALGAIDTKSGFIRLYSGERFGIAARAEELFHFGQLRDRGLLGKKIRNIPIETIEEIEREVEILLRRNGFRPKR